MLEPRTQVSYSSDCSSIRVTDATEYSGNWGKENILCRNIVVTDPYGEVVYGPSSFGSQCLAITPSYTFSWTFGAARYVVSDFYANGQRVFGGATVYTTLGDLVTALNALGLGTFSLSGSTISIVSSTNTFGQFVGLENGNPPTSAFTRNPVITVSNIVAGGSINLVFQDKAVVYTIKPEDISYPIGGLSTVNAVRMTEAAIGAGLLAAFESIRDYVECELKTTLRVSPCTEGCQIFIESTEPGVPIYGVSVQTSTGQGASLSTITGANCNWNFTYRYTWDFTSAADPIVSLSVTGLLSNGVNIVPFPFTPAGGSKADQLASIADYFNGYGIGHFSVTPTTLIALSTERLTTLTYTPGPVNNIPTAILASSELDAYKDIPVNKDGVYCITLSVEGETPSYAQASIQLPAVLPNDATVTLDVLNFPVPFSPFVIGYTGSTTSMAKAIEEQFNALMDEVYGIGTTNAYAYAIGTKVNFYVSIPYIQRTSPSVLCGTTTLTLDATIAGTGNPEFVAAGTELSFDELDCIVARDFRFMHKQCFAVMCRAKCCLSEIAIREYNSTSDTPTAMRMLTRIQAVEQLICDGQNRKAQDLIESIHNIVKNSGCINCGVYDTAVATTYSYTTKSSTKKCNC